MIDISIEKKGAAFRRLTFDGHAGFADYGSDIVCASVSVLVINAVNSVEAFTDDRLQVESDAERGYIDIRLPEVHSGESDLLFKSAMLGLKAIGDQYPDYVRIEMKEE